jgi:hypothetical protein
MRLISNEELLVVAGGEYWPTWEVEEFESILSGWGFEDFSYGANGKGQGKREVPPSERNSILEDLQARFPEAIFKIEAKIKGADGQVTSWEITITAEASSGKKKK